VPPAPLRAARSWATLATLTSKLAFALPPGPEASIVTRVAKPAEERAPVSARRTRSVAPDRLPVQATACLRPPVRRGEETEHLLALLTTAAIVSARCPLALRETV
jgi:hypothetical protein